MEYEEYINSLKEQIQNKNAKIYVTEEINNHIEELSEEYLLEGMDETQALQEAVKQMGDPVEIGQELNKIHRPKIPIVLLLLVLGLTIVGVFMQSVIFFQTDAQESAVVYFRNTIFFNLIGFFIICLFLRCNYTFIGRESYLLYFLFLLVGIIWFMFQNYPILNQTGSNLGYYILTFYPIVLAGLIYENRNQQIIGILRCLGLSYFALVWNYLFVGTGKARVIETFLIINIMLSIAIVKGIFGRDKKKMFLLTGIPLVVSGIVGVGLLLGKYFASYYLGYSYLINAQQRVARRYTLFGNHVLPYEKEVEMHTDFVLSSIFSWFGIILGIVVIAVLALFIVLSFKVSLKQSNRIGMLVGIACSSSILVRMLAYLAINFGWDLYKTTSIPFLSYGLVGSVVNAVFVGLILCIYRNRLILAEGENS